jgi:TonB family protein
MLVRSKHLVLGVLFACASCAQPVARPVPADDLPPPAPKVMSIIQPHMLDPAACAAQGAGEAPSPSLPSHAYVDVLIGETGQVEDALLAISSGSPVFDKSAVQAARSCAFSPLTVDGSPITHLATLVFARSAAKVQIPIFRSVPAIDTASPARQVRWPQIPRNDSCVVPDYPYLARAYSEQGVVIVHFLTMADGHTSSIDVVRSSGWPMLDQALENKIYACTFQPGTFRGKPVPMFKTIKYNFVLVK